ncbi:hypothetical protein SteCoe_10448 [Stentor coeruleus]|uniref:EF-hand domain-containing protein n=1 Tax=Stentor coeruleus TaxID=5963 RepID=A0A1R2CFT1_9CILI|nr:hypothetical protein SteCoe_10448 [Stentor coeruleus]
MSKQFPTKFLQDKDDYESSSGESLISDEPQKTNGKEKFSAERLMMMLDKQKLEALEGEFKRHPDGIELSSFVWLMKCAMNVSPEDRTELVLGLYYLFQEIDINGDEHMEWSEFTQYIIDAVMAHHTRELTENKELTPAQVMDSVYSLKNKRFQLSPTIDRNVHNGVIRQLAYYTSLDLISYIEVGGQAVKFVDSNAEVKYQVNPNLPYTSFVLSAAYSEKDLLFAITTSEKSVYVYEKDKDTFRFLKTFKTEFTNSYIWFFEKQKAWIVAGDDHILRQFDIRRGDEIFNYKGHNSQIMDAVEISKPLCFATCSLDNSIILWKCKDPEKIGMINSGHSRGVRSIDYCKESGGNLISVGYERYINVWCPELNLAKCHTGVLEGHNTPVVCCRFFRGKGICTSSDERGNIRIWDITQLSCLQIIANDRGKVDITLLVALHKQDKFAIAGKRLMFFELKSNVSNNEILYDIKPLNVEFNSYYMQFIVSTRFDVRIYDCLTGKLKKIYTDFKTPSEAELTTMVLDHRSRIILLGDSVGSLVAYNCANGSLITTIRAPRRKKQEISDNSVKNTISEDNYSEISALYYCNEDKILIVTSWASNIMIFDTKDISDVCLLRNLKGGHEGSDITFVTYSEYLSMIASGSSNGIISVWDFETGKHIGSFFNNSREIDNLIFVDPYPVLLSSSKDGFICLWNLQNVSQSYKNVCIARFETMSWREPNFCKATITSSINLICERVGILRECKKKYIQVKKYSESKNKKPKNHRYGYFLDNEDTKSISSFEWVEDKSEEKEPHNHDTKSMRRRAYMYLGDSIGYIKIWSFEYLLEKSGIMPSLDIKRTKPGYNPHRKDTKNAESDVNYWKKKTQNQHPPDIIDIESEILIKEWLAHTDQVTSIKLIPDPEGLLTCSSDKFLKIWSREGEHWGTINLSIPEIPKNWYFPFRWEKKRMNDVKKIVESLKSVDDNIDVDTKVKARDSSLDKFAKKPKPKQSKLKKSSFKTVDVERKDKPRQSAMLLESSFDDDLHKEEKKPQPAMKYEGSTASLKKMLDDLDEKRLRELMNYDKNASRLKLLTNNEQKSPDRHRTMRKTPKSLPKISIAKEPGEVAAKFDQEKGQKKSVRIPEEVILMNSQSQRTFKGRSLFGQVNYKFTAPKINQSPPKQKGKDEIGDVKFKVGESVRLMKEAISVQSIARSSELCPFTEDLAVLNMKKNILTNLTDKKKKKKFKKKTGLNKLTISPIG